ncbi:protein of unknown function [Streptococcus thermophilus]|nr:protein of unknown function [Streptococcus thermophilus]CAD0148595.1 protein of unknown function [Streptococcus thermophilus]CAD0149101.1 protein of unknown function [Streptococcus thermophilus]
MSPIKMSFLTILQEIETDDNKLMLEKNCISGLSLNTVANLI